MRRTKNRYKPYLRAVLLVVNLAAVLVLAAGLAAGAKGEYSQETWEDAIRGSSYLESGQFQHQASDSVYNVLEIIARSTRMETAGEYNPNKIIRIQDYLESRTVYDSLSANEKKSGLCYRLGDLYKWSLTGAEVRDNVLWEDYKPLSYGSIQEYCNEMNESYNVAIKQVMEAMEMVSRDVAEYQELKKSWTSEATNVRYALWDLGNDNVYTNVEALLMEEPVQDAFESYFKAFESYYIFDSRSTNVAQKNVGDYYSYNTHALLTGWSTQLAGEYQIYVGIDTAFPVEDQMAAGAAEYEEAKAILSAYIGPMIISVVVLAATLLYLLWKIAGHMGRFSVMAYGHANLVLKICILFVGYELIQSIIRMIFKDSAVGAFVILICKLAVLGLLIWEGVQRQQILEGVKSMMNGEEEAQISTNGLTQGNLQMAEAINELGGHLRDAMQDQMKSERMKADLITNVSHDLKTPLTSIINYVDLLKREKIENPKAQEYLKVLDQKSQRLKQLTEDLVEASRASSGNVTLDIQKIDLKELLMQTSGEFEEKFAAKGLKLMSHYPDYPLYVEADGRRLWRIIENLYRNVEKYAMPGTRVYLDVDCDGHVAALSMKNISEQPLNISPEELMERFTRGDESRTTEGSGLGLSIAKDLTELQGGTFQIFLDGDLFKVVVAFPWAAGGELA